MTQTRSYDLSGFDSIVATTGVNVIVTTGQPYGVRVEARDEETLDRLDVDVSGKRLHIGFSRNFLDFILNGGLMDLLRLGGNMGVTAYVALPELNGAEASSGGRIEATNVKSSRLRADASSGGQLTLLAVDGNDVRLGASSGGSLEIEGVCQELEGSASSGGHVRARRLNSKAAWLDASSGGAIDAAVSDKLRANASSGGGVRVIGDPADRDVNESSGGGVKFERA